MELVRELTPRRWLAVLAWLGLALVSATAAAQSMQEVLGPGDSVRISVYPYPDLTTEVRLAEDGQVNLPMIGRVELKGMTPDQASREIAERLVRGKFINNPQVDVAVLEARSRQVSVLGFVTRPGRYMLEGSTAKVSDVLAMAGGLVPEAADTAVVTRKGGEKSESLNVDLAAVIRGGQAGKDIEVRSGDSVFVPKAPVVYVYGEVIRGGSYRLEPGMTVMQAISVAGGITPRGSERRMSLRRRAADGKMVEKHARPEDLIAADDVIFVRESIF
jgi:polysaccharide export outer membrane protein